MPLRPKEIKGATPCPLARKTSLFYIIYVNLTQSSGKQSGKFYTCPWMLVLFEATNVFSLHGSVGGGVLQRRPSAVRQPRAQEPVGKIKCNTE